MRRLLTREFPYHARSDTRGSLRRRVVSLERVALWRPRRSQPSSSFTTFRLHVRARKWIATVPRAGPDPPARSSAPTRASTNSSWTARELARIFDYGPTRSPSFIRCPIHGGSRPSRRSTRRIFSLSPAPRSARISRRSCARSHARFPRATARCSSPATRLDANIHPDDTELRALYSGALAVAVPSSAEGYGLMAVEAMACGAPVVASDASALPEACDGAAMLVPPFDVNAWALALRESPIDRTCAPTCATLSLARAARIDRSEPARLTLALLRRSLESAR